MSTATETEHSTLEGGEVPEPIFSKRITHTDTGLLFAEDTTFDEWQQAYEFYDRLHERGRWWLGDCVRFAEGKFPDRYTQAIEMTGLSYSRLTTLVSVCSRILPDRRRKELSFGMHECVAYLPYQKADYLLDRAIKEKWDREELADAVARANGQPTRAEKKAAKEAKKGESSKSLPQAAKPTIDVNATATRLPIQSGFVWNGYPVTAKDGHIFAGAERLPDDEATRCAHHFRFADSAAMIANLTGDKATPATPAQPSKPPEPPTATSQPTATASPTAPSSAQLEPNQALALERSEAAFNIWAATIPTVDWENASLLTRKRWLSKILITADELIDRIQKTI